MNLANNPTTSDLQALLRSLNDDAGHHRIWVDTSGDVHVDEIDPGVGASNAYRPNEKFRLETLVCGNGYVGRAAADDQQWVNDLFGWLTGLWRKGHKGYSDAFADAD